MALINEVKKKKRGTDEEEKERPAGGSQKNLHFYIIIITVPHSLHCSCVREKHSSALCGVLFTS